MKILNCPICKSEPKLEVIDLDRGNGHGYPGCYSYVYSCPKCKLMKSMSSSTVYTPKDKVQNEAIKKWNEEVNRVRELMGKKPINYENEVTK